MLLRSGSGIILREHRAENIPWLARSKPGRSSPDQASLDEIIHALYLRAKFDRGEEEIRKGQGISHEEAKKKLQKWFR